MAFYDLTTRPFFVIYSVSDCTRRFARLYFINLKDLYELETLLTIKPVLKVTTTYFFYKFGIESNTYKLDLLGCRDKSHSGSSKPVEKILGADR